MAINFPNSPTLNQIYTFGENTWVWNGYAWDNTSTTYGPQGIQGTTGAGTQGTTGIQGYYGIQGNTGTQGIQGIQGTQGTTGIQGYYGIQGNIGAQGTQGIQGNQGTQGIQGVINTFATSASTAPTSPQQGQVWFDSNTGQYYIYYQTAWIEVAQSQVMAGLQGIQGLKGDTGAITVTNSSSLLSTTVTMTTANTLYSGTSLTLAAGTYAIKAWITVSGPASTAFFFNGRIYSSTTTYSSAEQYVSSKVAASTSGSVALNAIVTLASSTVINIGAVSDTNSTIIRNTPLNNGTTPTPSSANTATGIIALKI